MSAKLHFSFANTLQMTCCFNGSGFLLKARQDSLLMQGPVLSGIVLQITARCSHCGQEVSKRTEIKGKRSFLMEIRAWLDQEAQKAQAAATRR